MDNVLNIKSTLLMFTTINISCVGPLKHGRLIATVHHMGTETARDRRLRSNTRRATSPLHSRRCRCNLYVWRPPANNGWRWRWYVRATWMHVSTWWLVRRRMTRTAHSDWPDAAGIEPDRIWNGWVSATRWEEGTSKRDEIGEIIIKTYRQQTEPEITAVRADSGLAVTPSSFTRGRPRWSGPIDRKTPLSSVGSPERANPR